MLTAAIWQAKSWQREAAGLVERNRAEMAERGTSPGMLAPPPTPPSTDLIHKTDKPGRFQGMYESRLEREQVADFYRDWFAGQGYAMMPLERLAERGGWRFRRGSDTADLLFFAPRNETGAGCDFLLSSLSGAPAGQGAAATR